MNRKGVPKNRGAFFFDERPESRYAQTRLEARRSDFAKPARIKSKNLRMHSFLS
jgi:hypothetical protein